MLEKLYSREYDTSAAISRHCDDCTGDKRAGALYLATGTGQLQGVDPAASVGPYAMHITAQPIDDSLPVAFPWGDAVTGQLLRQLVQDYAGPALTSLVIQYVVSLTRGKAAPTCICLPYHGRSAKPPRRSHDYQSIPILHRRLLCLRRHL